MHDASELNVSQGWEPPLTNPDERAAAIEAAFHYRGDVTLHLTDDRCLEGFIFDRRPGRASVPSATSDVTVHMLIKRSTKRITVHADEIERLVFTGRDAAAGKSWERWVEHYRERKQAGLDAGLYPEWMQEGDGEKA